MGHSATHQQLHEYFNSRQFDRIEEALASSFLYEDLPRALTIKSHEEFIDYLNEWAGGFSDANVGSPQYVDGPDHSVALFHARGLNDGSIAGMPPTGKRMDVPFCEILHYGSDGQVTSGEIYYDQVTMLTQLGVIEAPAPSDSAESPADVVRSLFAAMDRLDFSVIRSLAADDAQGVDEIARRWLRGKDDLLAYLSQLEGAISAPHSDLSDVRQSITGNNALVTCWLDQEYTYEGNRVRVSAPTSIGLRRQDDGWRITLVHSVPLPSEQLG